MSVKTILMRDPASMTRQDLADVVGQIQAILWPGGDPDHEWDSETIAHVAEVMEDNGLKPDDDDDAA